MSFKDGIPLLTSFEDENDDDDFMMDSIAYPRRKKCKQRHVCIGVVLAFAAVMAIALAVGVSLAFTLKNKSGSQHGGEGNTGSNSNGGESMVYSISLLPSTDMAAPTGVTTASVRAPSLYTSLLEVSVQPSASVSSVLTPQVSSVSVHIVKSSFLAASTQMVSPALSPSKMVSPSKMESPAPSSSKMESPASSSSKMESPAPSSSKMESPAPSPSKMESPAPSPSKMESPASSSSIMESPSPSPSKMESPAPSPSIMESPASSSSMMESPSPSPSKMKSPAPSPTKMESLAPSPTILQSSSLFPTPSPTPLSCPRSEQCSDDTTLCPSQNDTRAYKYKVLDNSLRVVLISDPTTDFSGASMNVAAGSFNDPINYLGLAHFCEHMLFLGTRTYPDKHVYSEYLSTHGGYDNAYTSTQETDYHFRVGSNYLNRSLDYFSHFFIDPLFNADSVADEMNAVNQEHEKNLLSDSWILWQLLKTVSNPDHPFSQFSTGNFETLNQSDIRHQLWEYYNTTYSASTMNLVVYGREDLSDLEEMVDSYFSKIEDKGVVPVSYNTTAFPEGGNYTQRIIYYLPQASTNTLTLYWQTPSLQDHTRNSVGDFLGRYLGYEGKGSLLYYLQTQGLATELVAGTEVSTDSFSLFTMQLTLTAKGLSSASDVIRSVFQFTSLLANLTEEEFQDKWEAYIDIQRVTFDFAEKKSPNDFAVDISTVMRVVTNPGDILPNPRRYICNYNLAISTARYFTPENTIIFIGTKDFDGSSFNDSDDLNQVPRPVSLDRVEQYYRTNYSIVEVTNELLTYWSSGLSENPIKLAEPSMFIPSEMLEIYDSDDTAPRLTNSKTSENYFLTDARNFSNQPRVNFRCELKTKNSQETITWEALSKMYVALVKAVLQPHLYSATEVEYSYDLTSSPRGLILEFSGLSDVGILQRIINETMIKILNPLGEDSDSFFDLALDLTNDTLLNFNYTELPYRYTLHYIQRVIMDRPYWKNEQVLSVLEKLELHDLLEFANTSLLRDLSVTCLSHGNVNNETANLYANVLTGHLTGRISATHSPNMDFLRTRVILDSVGTYGVSLPSFNPVDKNSVVQVIYQAGPVCDVTLEEGPCSDESLMRSLHLSLLKQVISDACFTQLRTVEKLGYVVFCYSTVNEGIGSFQTLVQSGEHDPEHVLNSTLSFLTSFYNLNVSSREFNSSFDEKVDILGQSIEGSDVTLTDKTDRLWGEAISGHHQFDFREQKLAALGKLNYQGFLQFYNDTVLNEDSFRRLIIVVYGKDKAFIPPRDYAVNYHSLNQTQHTLPTS